MREITLVEKVETSAIIPNAVHITTKSKVSLYHQHWVCMFIDSKPGSGKWASKILRLHLSNDVWVHANLDNFQILRISESVL